LEQGTKDARKQHGDSASGPGRNGTHLDADFHSTILDFDPLLQAETILHLL
jgi:hypothetical protein